MQLPQPDRLLVHAHDTLDDTLDDALDRSRLQSEDMFREEGPSHFRATTRTCTLRSPFSRSRSTTLWNFHLITNAPRTTSRCGTRRSGLTQTPIWIGTPSQKHRRLRHLQLILLLLLLLHLLQPLVEGQGTLPDGRRRGSREILTGLKAVLWKVPAGMDDADQM